jgi:two-component system CheB/CheR fusion protein
MTATAQKPGEQVVLKNEEFLTMLAHELRNPLAPIMNAIHVIERNAVNSNQLVRNSTEILSRQVNYVVGVINDLLDVARIAKGDLTINKERVEVCACVKQAVEECRTVLSSRKHLLEVTLPEKSLWVIGDDSRIKQIISHLLNNAAKFTETGGKISITVNYGDNRVMINVRDTGVGIESPSEIFTLFSKSPSLHNLSQGGGMGVGLMLSRELAEIMGGTIEADSGGIGKGSEFSVILPLQEVGGTIQQVIKPPTVEKPSRCLDIMVVDDHIDTAESLATLLKMWGHMVRVCHSGAAAIQMAKVYHPDVALLDIGLPGCDGYQVADEVKKECPDILLIAVTGYGQRVDRRRSGNAGFHTHLVKPVVPDKLKEALAVKSEAG